MLRSPLMPACHSPPHGAGLQPFKVVLGIFAKLTSYQQSYLVQHFNHQNHNSGEQIGSLMDAG